jgi:hypothetical protein
VIEGFFGRPWEWPARISTADFLREYDYHFYIYAPKSDPFLRRRWREPTPDDLRRNLVDLSGHCRSRGLAFGMGLSPFEIYRNYDASARAALRAKVLQLNAVGVDLLCLLFDDMHGNVPDLAALQVAIVSEVCGWSDAREFLLCPTYYSSDPRLAQKFGPPPRHYLRDLGRGLDPKVGIFWTGEQVISPGYTTAHLREVANELGRRPFLWDNHLANDSRTRTDHLYLELDGSTWSFPPDCVSGIAINPMNQPYLSRIPLAGLRQRIFSPDASKHDSQELCRVLCGDSVAEALLSDHAVIERGRAQMDSATRQRLLGRYQREYENPYARDMAAWIRGDFVFDPECLTS